MAPASYRVFDKKDLTPVSMQNMSSYRMAQYEDDEHLFQINEDSSCPSRFFLCAGMKPHTSAVVPHRYS